MKAMLRSLVFPNKEKGNVDIYRNGINVITIPIYCGSKKMLKNILLGIAVIVIILFVSGLAFSESGVAILKGTVPGSTVSGIIRFEDTPEGLRIVAEVSNVPKGKHGFHIHEFGRTTNSGKDAGGHFNPERNPHGYLPADGIENAHAGDLGNIIVGSDGSGALELVVRGLTLSGGNYSVGGRAVILHEKVDDLGQPTGNAGPRIGAGTIIITGK
jgi:Cu-Zn family superoxide dismutase